MFSRRMKIGLDDPTEADLSGLNGLESRKNRSATETLSTTLSKLCQQRHAANSWRYFDARRRLVYRHDTGGTLARLRSERPFGERAFRPNAFGEQFVYRSEDKRSLQYDRGMELDIAKFK